MKTIEKLLALVLAVSATHSAVRAAQVENLQAHSGSRLASPAMDPVPSWKTLIKAGVLMEMWNGGGAQMPSCGGAIGGWLFQSVLGIQHDPDGPGFKKFILAPQPDPATGLNSAQGYYDCPYGRITSEWKCSNGQVTLHVAIPVNTTATVFVSTSDPNLVMESGVTASHAVGVQFLRSESHAAVYEAASGIYDFTAERHPKYDLFYTDCYRLDIVPLARSRSALFPSSACL